MDQIFQMDVHDIVERISTWELDSHNIFINRLYDLKWKKSVTHSFFVLGYLSILDTQQAQLATVQFLMCEVSEVDQMIPKWIPTLRIFVCKTAVWHSNFLSYVSQNQISIEAMNLPTVSPTVDFNCAISWQRREK